MKISRLVIGSLILLTSCYKTIDSTKEVCTSGCTIVQGRVTTLNDRAVSGVKVKIGSIRNTSSASGVTRNIAETTSDAFGHYQLKFSLNEQEWGLQSTAEVYLRYSYDTTVYAPLSAGLTDVLISSPRLLLFTNKEITVDRSIYLSLKAKANIRLQGFYTSGSDYNGFYVTPTFRSGVYNYYRDGAYVATVQSATIEQLVNVAGNDTTRFRIEKRKSGQRFLSDTAVYTPLAQTTNLVFTF